MRGFSYNPAGPIFRPSKKELFMAKPDKAIKAMKTTLVAAEYNVNKAIACIERAVSSGQVNEEAAMAYQALERIQSGISRLFESPQAFLSVDRQAERVEREFDQFLVNLKQLLSDPTGSRHIEAAQGLAVAARIGSRGGEFASWLTDAPESAWLRER
jgi:hypothetical protein